MNKHTTTRGFALLVLLGLTTFVLLVPAAAARAVGRGQAHVGVARIGHDRGGIALAGGEREGGEQDAATMELERGSLGRHVITRG